MSKIADRYRRLSEHFVDLVDRVPDDAWSSPSPCDEWTARDVVSHVVDVHGMMLKPLDRGLSEAPAVGVDPRGAIRAATADIQAVLDDPALATTEYDGYFGTTTVQATIDQFLGLDLVVHAWDLATAAGLDAQMPDDEIARVRADAEGLGDNMRAPNVVGPALDPPAGASDQDRLLAFLGRDPQWSPGTAKARA